jgi:hypothetical protein
VAAELTYSADWWLMRQIAAWRDEAEYRNHALVHNARHVSTHHGGREFPGRVTYP